MFLRNILRRRIAQVANELLKITNATDYLYRLDALITIIL